MTSAPHSPHGDRPCFDVVDDDSLVWILGSSRSGSTWLTRMLADLPGTVAIDDPHLGHHLGVWRPIPLAWATAERRPDLATLTELRRSRPDFFFSERYEDTWRPLLRQLIAARFAAQAADTDPGCRHVVVKEPGSQVAELLLSMFPRSRLVFLLRDGRDVVDSWLAGYRDGAWAQDEGAFALAKEGREAFIRWQACVWAHRADAVSRAYEQHDPERRVLVRYEDLLADPVAGLERICRASGIDAGGDRLERIASAHDFNCMPSALRGADRHIRSAQPGGWRRAMSTAEQRAMLEEMGEMLLRFGYIEAEVLSAADPERLPAERGLMLPL